MTETYIACVVPAIFAVGEFVRKKQLAVLFSIVIVRSSCAAGEFVRRRQLTRRFVTDRHCTIELTFENIYITETCVTSSTNEFVRKKQPTTPF